MKFFCKSFIKDLEWCTYMVRSVAKFAPSSAIVIVVEDGEKAAFDEALGKLHRSIDVHEVSSFAPEANSIQNGYIRQQYVKLISDLVINESHVHIDSDVVITEPVTAKTWFEGNKPIWLTTSYAHLGSSVPWRRPTETTLKFNVELEYMRAAGNWMEPDLLKALRSYMERDGVQVWRFMTTVTEISEYNLYGAFVHRFHPDRYHWVDTVERPDVKRPVDQAWSYGGITSERRSMLETLLQ